MSLSAEIDDSGRSHAGNRAYEASVPHPGWEAALVQAADGARTRRLTAVVGEAGTGKSLLLGRLRAELEASGLSVSLVRDPRSDQLAAADVLLLDAADRLSPDDLRTLCAQAPSCVLAGRPELEPRLAELGAASLDDEPAVVRLPTLTAEQTGGFFRALVLRDFGPGAEVRDDAVAAMAEHSAGVPRTVVILAGLAAFAAGLEDAEQILAAVFVALLFHGKGGRLGRIFDSPVSQYLGRLSYSVYLFNIIYLLLVEHWAQGSEVMRRYPLEYGVLLAVPVVAAGILTAHFTERLVERPCIAFGRRVTQFSVQISA